MRRLANAAPDIESDPELRAAYWSLQLYLLRSVPGYREEVRARVSDAARRAEARANKMDRVGELEREKRRVLLLPPKGCEDE